MSSSGAPGVTLFLTVRPEGLVHRRLFGVDTPISDVRGSAAEALEVPPGSVWLGIGGVELKDGEVLGMYAVTPGGETDCEVRVEFLEPERAQVRLEDSGFLDVVVEESRPSDAGASGVKTIRVAIVRLPDWDRKPFLGGFRTKNGDESANPESANPVIEYHHASSQTPSQQQQRQRGTAPPPKAHRDTQTLTLAARSTQPPREAATQMPRPGVYIDPRGSKELHAGVYVPAGDVLAERVRKAVRIQCFIRGWFARRLASQRRDVLRTRAEAAAAEERRRGEAADERRRGEVERRMRPRGAADFAVLHSELESWRLSETQRIKQSDLPPPQKSEALALLLNKETRLLQTIDRLKIQAAGENRDSRISRLLQLMAAPKKWQLSDGTLAEVETPFTMRAKELMDLYSGLRLPLLGLDERLDVLLHVKWTVKEFDCNLTREIVELIDREADMLNRGRTERALAGLRKRLANLFLQFAQTPEFNPEAVRFQKVPKELLRPGNGQIAAKIGGNSTKMTANSGISDENGLEMA